MRPLGRFGAVLLGVMLAATWSAGAGAGPTKKKGLRPAAPSSQGPSPGQGFKAPSFQRHEPGTARRPSAFEPAPDRREPQVPRTQNRTPQAFDRPNAPALDRGVPSRQPTARRPLPGRSLGGPGLAPQGAPPSLAPLHVVKLPQTISRGGRTYRQEPLLHGDQTFVRRTRVDDGAIHHGGQPGEHHGGHAGHGGDSDRYYHHHHWGHHDYWVYVPFWTYDPWFWGFYFAPFPAPWYYTWGWMGAPWYVSWGWYFEPYPYYAGPSYWVTDYTLSRALEDEYDRGYEAGRESTAGAPISEPVKEQVRVEVDAAAKAIQTEQPIALDSALADPSYLFIVDAPISAATSTGATCALTGGDIIKAAAPVDPDVPVATMGVVTSKREDCPAGALVSVSYTDLQEMLNSFSESVDDGMHELENQSTPR